jgi:hypothetical protein
MRWRRGEGALGEARLVLVLGRRCARRAHLEFRIAVIENYRLRSRVSTKIVIGSVILTRTPCGQINAYEQISQYSQRDATQQLSTSYPMHILTSVSCSFYITHTPRLNVEYSFYPPSRPVESDLILPPSPFKQV